MSRPFRFDWKIALFSAVFLSIFVLLGFWQLERASDKERLIAAGVSRHAQAEVAITQAPGESARLQGLPVVLVGLYQPDKSFLLDNRVLKGKVGFELLLPFQVDDGPLVMVNRGFVAMGRTRDDTPSIPDLKEGSMAQGHIYIMQQGYFELKEDLSEVTRWPRIIQQGDPAMLETLLGETLYPHVVRLKPDDPNALPRNWPITVMLPEKHRGYAIQWFAMALAVSVAFMFYSFRPASD